LLILVLPVFVALLALHAKAFQGIGKIRYFALLNMAVRPVFLLTLVSTIYVIEQLSIYNVLIAYGFALCLTLITAYWLWSASAKSANAKSASVGPTNVTATNISTAVVADLDKRQIENDLAKLLPSMWLVSLLAIVMDQGGQFLVGMLSNAEQSAYYGVAARIAAIVSFIVLAFNGALAPKFAELYASKQLKKMYTLYVKETFLRVLILTPLLLLVIYFADLILTPFGEQYIAAKSVLIWLIVGKLVNTIIGPTGLLLMMTGRHKVQRNHLIFSCFTLIACASYTIPLLGAEGAAMAVCLAVVVNNIFGAYQLIKQFFKHKKLFSNPI